MLVLVAGGTAAGKRTICQAIKQQITREDNQIKVELVDMAGWQREKYGPSVDFDGLIKHVARIKDAVVLVHGKYALYSEELRQLADFKLFADTDSDEQLSQWLLRDKDTTDINQIFNEYLNFARVEFQTKIAPTKDHADVLLPRGMDASSISILSRNLVDLLRKVHSEEPVARVAQIDLRRELLQDSRYYSAT